MAKISASRQKAIDELLRVLGAESKSVARLLLVVDYDRTLGTDEIEEVLEKAREQGGIEVAEYLHLAPTRESLV